TPSAGQTERAVSASGPDTSAPSTPPSATDHAELAEFSGLLEKIAGADLQVAFDATPSAGQTEPAVSASGPDTSAPSTPLSATDHPARAEFSSLLGKFAGADLPAASDPTPSAGQTERAVSASGPDTSAPSTPPSATDHPARAEFSSLLGKFAGAEIN